MRRPPASGAQTSASDRPWWRRLWPPAPTPRRVAKMVQLASNPFAQPEVRMRQMERLIEIGGSGGALATSALRGVLRRFAVQAQGHIADEEEKAWLVDALVALGEPALPALHAFLREEARLSLALGVLTRVSGQQAADQQALAVLRHHGPDDHRMGEAKLQLVRHLADSPELSRHIGVLTAFVQDHSDEVQAQVLRTLAQADADGRLPAPAREAALAALSELQASGRASPRIRQASLALEAQLRGATS